MAQEQPKTNLFANKGKKWSPEEEARLLDEYGDQDMGILEVAKLHQRTVEGVISKLKSAGLVTKYARSDDYEQDVVGYAEYLADEEYREAERVTRIKKEKPLPRLLSGTLAPLVPPTNEVNILRAEVDELKAGMKTMKEQMFAMSMSLLKMK